LEKSSSIRRFREKSKTYEKRSHSSFLLGWFGRGGLKIKDGKWVCVPVFGGSRERGILHHPHLVSEKDN